MCEPVALSPAGQRSLWVLELVSWPQAATITKVCGGVWSRLSWARLPVPSLWVEAEVPSKMRSFSCLAFSHCA